MPVSHRHRRAARLLTKHGRGPAAPAQSEYLILDKDHRPDLRGQFAGAMVSKRGDGHYVSLTPAQAKFYLAQGAIKRTVAPEQQKLSATNLKSGAPVAKQNT